MITITKTAKTEYNILLVGEQVLVGKHPLLRFDSFEDAKQWLWSNGYHVWGKVSERVLKYCKKTTVST